MAADHCADNADIFQPLCPDVNRIFSQYGDIGALTGFQTANLIFHFQRIGRTHGDGVKRFFNADVLCAIAQCHAAGRQSIDGTPSGKQWRKGGYRRV